MDWLEPGGRTARTHAAGANRSRQRSARRGAGRRDRRGDDGGYGTRRDVRGVEGHATETALRCGISFPGAHRRPRRQQPDARGSIARKRCAGHRSDHVLAVRADRPAGAGATRACERRRIARAHGDTEQLERNRRRVSDDPGVCGCDCAARIGGLRVHSGERAACGPAQIVAAPMRAAWVVRHVVLESGRHQDGVCDCRARSGHTVRHGTVHADRAGDARLARERCDHRVGAAGAADVREPDRRSPGAGSVRRSPRGAHRDAIPPRWRIRRRGAAGGAWTLAAGRDRAGRARAKCRGRAGADAGTGAGRGTREQLARLARLPDRAAGTRGDDRRPAVRRDVYRHRRASMGRDQSGAHAVCRQRAHRPASVCQLRRQELRPYPRCARLGE